MGGPTVELERLLIRLVGDASGYTNMLKQVQGQTMTAANRLAEMGKMMTFAVTAPIVAMGALSIREFMKFETAMARIEGLVAIPHDVVQGYSQEILAMSAELGIVPEKLARALYFITSSGIQAVDHIDLLRTTARASVAGLAEIDVVADVVTSAISAYGAANLSAAQATDILIATVREGKAEGAQLARTMGRTLPLAVATGVQFHELGAAIAGMTRITGAEIAVTQMRAILSTLANPTREANDALADVGLSAAGLRAQIKEGGLISALILMKEKIGGNIDSLEHVFGNVRALAGILQLLGPSMADNIRLFDVMTRTAGTTDNAFAVMARTVQFDWDRAMAAIKVSMVLLGAILSPVARAIAETVSRAATWWEQLSVEGKRVVVIIATMVAAIGPLLLLMGAIGPVFIAGFGRLSQISARIVTFAAVFGRHGVLGTAIGLMWQFALPIAAVAATIVLVISYFGDLGNTLSFLKNSADWVLDKLYIGFLAVKMLVIYLPAEIEKAWGALIRYLNPLITRTLVLTAAFSEWLITATVAASATPLANFLAGMATSLMLIAIGVVRLGELLVWAFNAIVSAVPVAAIDALGAAFHYMFIETAEVAFILRGSLVGAIIGILVLLKAFYITVGIAAAILRFFRVQQILTYAAVVTLRSGIITLRTTIWLWTASCLAARAIMLALALVVIAVYFAIQGITIVVRAAIGVVALINWAFLGARLAVVGATLATWAYIAALWLMRIAVIASYGAYVAALAIARGATAAFAFVLNFLHTILHVTMFAINTFRISMLGFPIVFAAVTISIGIAVIAFYSFTGVVYLATIAVNLIRVAFVAFRSTALGAQIVTFMVATAMRAWAVVVRTCSIVMGLLSFVIRGTSAVAMVFKIVIASLAIAISVVSAITAIAVISIVLLKTAIILTTIVVSILTTVIVSLGMGFVALGIFAISAITGIIYFVGLLASSIIGWVILVGIIVGVVGLVTGLISGITAVTTIIGGAIFGGVLFVIYSSLIAVYGAAKSLLGLFLSFRSTSTGMAHVGRMFGEWWDIIKLIVRALQVDMDLAWKIVGAGFNLVVSQLKDIFPPLWTLIVDGFAVAFDMVVELFVEAQESMLRWGYYYLNYSSTALLGDPVAIEHNLRRRLQLMVRDESEQKKIADRARDRLAEVGAAFNPVDSAATAEARDRLRELTATLVEVEAVAAQTRLTLTSGAVGGGVSFFGSGGHIAPLTTMAGMVAGGPLGLFQESMLVDPSVNMLRELERAAATTSDAVGKAKKDVEGLDHVLAGSAEANRRLADYLETLYDAQTASAPVAPNAEELRQQTRAAAEQAARMAESVRVAGAFDEWNDTLNMARTTGNPYSAAGQLNATRRPDPYAAVGGNPAFSSVPQPGLGAPPNVANRELTNQEVVRLLTEAVRHLATLATRDAGGGLIAADFD